MAVDEAVVRRIDFLRDRIKKREGIIVYLEATIKYYRETHPELTHRELMYIQDYAEAFNSLRSYRGWQTRDQKEIERLEKQLPPYKYKQLRLTFSIETGTGHEPFLAEVTVTTIIEKEKDEDEYVERIVNASLKYFWITFDANKDITKDHRELWGIEIYNSMKSELEMLRRSRTLKEEQIDSFLDKLIQLGGLSRPPDQYVTKEAIQKIGIEPSVPVDESMEPKYPEINVFIEKKKIGYYKTEVNIIISEKTEIDLLERLEIELMKE